MGENNMESLCNSEPLCCPIMEYHNHELQGSVKIAEPEEDPHNHRFATVSQGPMPFGNSHVHRVNFKTDSYEGHFHQFCGISSPAIFVGNGKHVHFINAITTVADGHVHEFNAATLIEDPIED
jgi:hypothetical protein